MSLILSGDTGISSVEGTAAVPALIGNDADSGIFFTSGGATAISANGTEQFRIGSTGNLLCNSGYGSAAVAYGCRAWVNFNGTGTPAIRGSGNVASITDNGTGDYTINFTTALVDVNYSVVGTSAMRTGDGALGLLCVSTLTAYTTSLFRIKTFNGAGGAEDFPTVNVAVFR